jgi:hypothetical protein
MVRSSGILDVLKEGDHLMGVPHAVGQWYMNRSAVSLSAVLNNLAAIMMWAPGRFPSRPCHEGSLEVHLSRSFRLPRESPLLPREVERWLHPTCPAGGSSGLCP